MVVLGARSLGAAIVDRFLADGWRAAAVARSEQTLAAVAERGALALAADALDPPQLATALDRARAELGGLDLIVNALSVTPSAETEPWGGGPIGDAQLAQWERWTATISRAAFVFLSEGARALRAGGGGTLVQISNGAALRPSPHAALVAGGQHSVRGLTHAAAQDLREEGIRACLLIVDAPIWSPKSAAELEARGHGSAQADVADQGEIAKAVAFLHGQGPGGTVYDLVIRPTGLPWIPA
jgi:3-oxoacyl-[acyl-carrier protein] reductase